MHDLNRLNSLYKGKTFVLRATSETVLVVSVTDEKNPTLNFRDTFTDPKHGEVNTHDLKTFHQFFYEKK